ncbi:putative C6 transcription factor [Hypomontagnella monticulosa]|nr:putative C6 transcription factor [Hypomontagnella monticulosa]
MKRNKKSPEPVTPSTVEDLKTDPEIGYKLRVLLFDLRNIQNPESERRILSTTHELYISTPYFTTEEAVRVRTATATATVGYLEPEGFDYEGAATGDAGTKGGDGQATEGNSQSEATIQTVEDAIHTRLENFFEKRKASGDMRPCGPHDMAPVYESVFNISSTELKDERFHSRLRRQGLPTITPFPASLADSKEQGRPNRSKNVTREESMDFKRGKKGRK